MAPGMVLALLGYGVAWWGVKLATHSAPVPILYALTRLGSDSYGSLSNCPGAKSAGQPGLQASPPTGQGRLKLVPQAAPRTVPTWNPPKLPPLPKPPPWLPPLPWWLGGRTA